MVCAKAQWQDKKTKDVNRAEPSLSGRDNRQLLEDTFSFARTSLILSEEDAVTVQHHSFISFSEIISYFLTSRFKKLYSKFYFFFGGTRE